MLLVEVASAVTSAKVPAGCARSAFISARVAYPIAPEDSPATRDVAAVALVAAAVAEMPAAVADPLAAVAAAVAVVADPLALVALVAAPDADATVAAFGAARAVLAVASVVLTDCARVEGSKPIGRMLYAWALAVDPEYVLLSVIEMLLLIVRTSYSLLSGPVKMSPGLSVPTSPHSVPVPATAALPFVTAIVPTRYHCMFNSLSGKPLLLQRGGYKNWGLWQSNRYPWRAIGRPVGRSLAGNEETGFLDNPKREAVE